MPGLGGGGVVGRRGVVACGAARGGVVGWRGGVLREVVWAPCAVAWRGRCCLEW